jgi:branched-chain amino acid transport system substrate-binding protein
MKRSICPSLAVAAMLAVSGCGGSDAAESSKASSGGGDNPKVIKLGAPLELTGPAAAFGSILGDSMKLAVETINANGGIKSMGGAKLELVMGDAESNPQRAVQLVRDMDRQGVTALVGPVGSATVVGTKPVIVSLGIPWVGSTLEDTITDDSNGNIWRTVSRFGDWGEKTMDFLEEAQTAGKIDVKKVGIVTIETPPGPALNKVLQARSKALGWEVSNFTYNPAETRDFSNIVAGLKQANVDLVVGLNYPADSILFAKAMTLQDWRPKEGFVWVAGGQYLNDFRKALGTKTQNWLNAAYMAPQSKCGGDVQKFVTAYEERYKQPLTGLAGSGPAIIAIVADALERAGSADREKFKQALAETDIKPCQGLFTMAGGVKFNEKGDNAAFVPTIVQHEGAMDQVAVAPAEVAAREASWPAQDKAGN